MNSLKQYARQTAEQWCKTGCLQNELAYKTMLCILLVFSLFIALLFSCAARGAGNGGVIETQGELIEETEDYFLIRVYPTCDTTKVPKTWTWGDPVPKR